MQTKRISTRLARLIAHRGLSALETENTNAAFIAAANRTYFGIETDVRKTADGKTVLCHDADLKRIAGMELLVESTSLSDLRQILLYDKAGQKTRHDLRLSVPEDYFSICRRYEKHAVLELKSDFSEEEIASMMRTAASVMDLKDLTVISFSYENLKKLRALYPEQSAQYLFREITSELLSRLAEDGIDVDVAYKALTPEWVAAMHEKGLCVNCWTVDDEQTADKLLSWGVDFITTNVLESD